MVELTNFRIKRNPMFGDSKLDDGGLVAAFGLDFYEHVDQ